MPTKAPPRRLSPWALPAAAVGVSLALFAQPLLRLLLPGPDAGVPPALQEASRAAAKGRRVRIGDLLRGLGLGGLEHWLELHFRSLWRPNVGWAFWRASRGVRRISRGSRLRGRWAMEVVLRDRQDENSVRPVLLWVPEGYEGGAAARERVFVTAMAKALGCSVAAVDMPGYPKTTVWGQVEAVGEATAWVKSTEGREFLGAYDVELGGVILVGHGSGAHVAALSALWAAMDAAGGKSNPAAKLSGSRVVANEGCAHPTNAAHDEADFFVQSVMPDAVVGIGGIYDVAKYQQYEDFAGIRDSVMEAACGFAAEALKTVSPEQVLDVMEPPALQSVPPLFLIHGDWDLRVPLSSSRCFASTLERARERAADASERDQYIIVEDMGHEEFRDEIAYLRKETPMADVIFAQVSYFVEGMLEWRLGTASAGASDVWREADARSVEGSEDDFGR